VTEVIFSAGAPSGHVAAVVAAGGVALPPRRSVEGVGIAVLVLILTLAALMAALLAAARRPSPAPPFPWLWTLPAVVVIGLSVLVGVAHYPALPDQIPVHFDLRGAADRFVATTPFTALFPIMIQVLVTAVLAVAAALLLRAPGGTRKGPAAIATLLLAGAMDLAFLLLAQPVWRGETTLSAGPPAGAAVCVVAGVVAVLVTSFRARRTDGPDPAAAADDTGREAHWRGFLYINPDDPALFVPKRFGIGWTVNFGRPAGWVVLGVLVGLPVLTAIIGTHA
jgi:uncharacterized membrane protein